MGLRGNRGQDGSLRHLAGELGRHGQRRGGVPFDQSFWIGVGNAIGFGVQQPVDQSIGVGFANAVEFGIGFPIGNAVRLGVEHSIVFAFEQPVGQSFGNAFDFAVEYPVCFSVANAFDIGVEYAVVVPVAVGFKHAVRVDFEQPVQFSVAIGFGVWNTFDFAIDIEHSFDQPVVVAVEHAFDFAIANAFEFSVQQSFDQPIQQSFDVTVNQRFVVPVEFGIEQSFGNAIDICFQQSVEYAVITRGFSMPDITPTFQDLTPSTFTNANVGQWYFEQNIGLVPDTVAPYLAAHGFIVNGGTENYINGEFAGYLLNMERNKFSRQDAIQLLLNTQVFSFNEGRELNQRRYEDLVSNLQTLLSNNQADITAFLNNSVTNNTGYVTLLLSTLTQMEADQTSFANDVMSYDTGERAAELAILKTNWTVAAAAAEAEYATMTAGLDVPDLLSDMETALSTMDAALAAFNTAHSGLATTLASDYATHAAAATAFLTSLGVTELARINETFDDQLTAQNALLVNRGFYSSALSSQVVLQVERERTQAIIELNDKLNREKWENQHRIYEQQYRMRLGALEASYKVFQGAAEVLAARLSHGQFASRVRHEIAQLSIQARLALLGVREKYYQYLLQSLDWQTDRRMKIYDSLFKTRLETLRVRREAGGFHSELIRYQLAQRSNLALALFGLVERREDDYPGVGDLVATVSSLGDDQ